MIRDKVTLKSLMTNCLPFFQTDEILLDDKEF